MEKLKQVLQSRKFWALVTSLVTVGGAFYTGSISAIDAVQAVVAALAAYSVSTALDN